MSAAGSVLEPIKTAHLFSRLEDLLVQLLTGLTHEEWARPTVSPRWKVKDVAAHLLDTEVRLLSMARDRHFSEAPGDESDAALVAFVNRLNREGVEYFRRVSPAVLTAFIASMAKPLSDYFVSLDPSAPAPFGVSWAGERVSTNWFNTAREFTERWHHQQQIRLAVGKPGIMTRELHYPVLDCFMRALPHSYREVRAADGTVLQVRVSGECGGDWYLRREAGRWRLLAQPAAEKVAQVTIPQDIAWRLFTKGIDRDEATAQIEVQGDVVLGLHILSALAIVGLPR